MVTVLEYRPWLKLPTSKRRRLSDAPPSIDDDLWFPESAMDYPLEKIQNSTHLAHNEDFGYFLSSVQSVDHDDDVELPALGISAEGLSGILTLLSSEALELTPRPTYLGPPTPPTIKPTFTELPPIISPSDIYLDTECESIDDAFQPPSTDESSLPSKSTRAIHRTLSSPAKRSRRSTRGTNCSSPVVNCSSTTTMAYERRMSQEYTAPRNVLRNTNGGMQVDRLVECMRKSHSSRRELLRCRSLFGNHPSLNVLERLDDSQRRFWTFMLQPG
jgi:hypothetical protein